MAQSAWKRDNGGTELLLSAFRSLGRFPYLQGGGAGRFFIQRAE